MPRVLNSNYSSQKRLNTSGSSAKKTDDSRSSSTFDSSSTQSKNLNSTSVRHTQSQTYAYRTDTNKSNSGNSSTPNNVDKEDVKEIKVALDKMKNPFAFSVENYKQGKIEKPKYVDLFFGLVDKAATWCGNKLNNVIDFFKQGSCGDCGFLSAAKAAFSAPKAGQASDGMSGRERLKKTIKDNGDGTYNVTFLGDKSKTYRITQRDIANTATKRRDKNSDLEIAILKAAVTKRTGKTALFNPGNMLALFTGKKVKQLSMDSLVKSASASKDTAKNGVVKLKKSTCLWRNNHEYQVEGIDLNRKALVLINPHNTSKREYLPFSSSITAIHQVA